MCGISAIVSDGFDDLGLLERMHAPIGHRGPDGEGFIGLTTDGAFVESSTIEEFRAKSSGSLFMAAIAFRWLKIQDLSPAARQPMTTRDKAVCIAFNGEIYNFRELRSQLVHLGHTFETHSDTEVALAAYAQWGVQCFERFNGMWSIVIIDRRTSTVVISRDRVGIKPLFVQRTPGTILLASETKQLVLSASGRPRADLDSIARFLSRQRHQTDRTYFDGIHPFPAASYAEVRLGPDPRLETRRYWDIGVTSNGASYSDAVSRAEEILTSAVEMQLVADVGVGTLLSGGLDSSLLTVIAARSGPIRRPAFSFVPGSADDVAIDESAYIDEVVQSTGVPLHKTTINAEWVRENLGRVTVAQETPLTGIPIMAQYRTHELAAHHGMRVVLDGQGADEVFGGYLRHQATFLNDLLRHGRPISFVRELMAFARVDPGYPARYVRSGILAPLRSVANPENRRTPSWFLGTAEVTEVPRQLEDRSLLNRQLYRDITQINIPTVLGITDRNSMAHSIEARVPLLDHRLIEFAFSLPPEFKVGAGRRKRILRSLASRYLPSSVIQRTDSLGFGTPQSRWVRQELAVPIRDALADEVLRNSPLVDRHALSTERDITNLWLIFALRAWLRSFDVSLA